VDIVNNMQKGCSAD